ncbi:receptor-type adenylate cyclase, putative [Trypanosoma cruzi]|nr:receptor-type adenylate cyclase, putative [Trypanosoma cruzi]
MGFAATRLVHTLFSQMHHLTAELLTKLYKNADFDVDDDMLYGPFADGRACPATESGAGCGRNYGATYISVWPLARALDPAVPLLFPSMTPSMKYADPAAGGLTARQLIGVIAGCAAAALLLVAVVFVLFSEFALLHAEFVAAFRDGAGADRVLFATSLPHWNEKNSTSETARKFAAAVPREEDRTPLSLMGFAATRLVHTLFSQMHHLTAELLTKLYKNADFDVDDDMLYGPFADGRACPATESGAGCGRNYGATYISVWPLARALDPAVPLLFLP